MSSNLIALATACVIFKQFNLCLAVSKYNRAVFVDIDNISPISSKVFPWAAHFRHSISRGDSLTS